MLGTCQGRNSFAFGLLNNVSKPALSNTWPLPWNAVFSEGCNCEQLPSFFIYFSTRSKTWGHSSCQEHNCWQQDYWSDISYLSYVCTSVRIQLVVNILFFNVCKISNAQNPPKKLSPQLQLNIRSLSQNTEIQHPISTLNIICSVTNSNYSTQY